MERTVPTTESEEVELYQRTYYSLLRSSAEVKVRSLEEVHGGMNSLLHPLARSMQPDMSAFLYSILRLPACMPDVRQVVLGQSAEIFERAGLPGFCDWEEVYAPARRRRCLYNGSSTLACYIASRSDIDDVIPLLTAYQLEWNKLHDLLRRTPSSISLDDMARGTGFTRLAEMLNVNPEDIDRLYAIWDSAFITNLERIAHAPLDLRVRLLSSSLNEYRRARNSWWENIQHAVPELRERPVYFISSNTHSLVNVLSGFALRSEEKLVGYLQRPGNGGLMRDWLDIQNGVASGGRENFLYYVLRKYQQSEAGRQSIRQQLAHERSMGILRVRSQRSFDVDAQVIRLSSLDAATVDPRLGLDERTAEALRRSDALVLNIDYPLGLSAYDILAEVSSHVGEMLGVYVMGKAATLNAVIGDVMISNVVHDEHSHNTYLFPNAFNAGSVAPHLTYGSVLDNQKSVTVQGTFLQNHQYMDVFYREGYTVIEMEAGPYLSAVYEMFRPQRHPTNEIVNLYGIPFDLGFIHYASDTPLGKGKNLGAGSLSYQGMDPTYAATLAILQRILDLERKRAG
ncbi:MAG: DUF6909 family protein [Chloroflexota bacterium]